MTSKEKKHERQRDTSSIRICSRRDRGPHIPPGDVGSAALPQPTGHGDATALSHNASSALGGARVLDLAFWGGLYGILFGLALPWLRPPYWLEGLGLGIIAALVGFFVVAPLKGLAIGGGWMANNWVRSLLINGFWGIGVGLILPLILPRRTRYA